MDALSEQGLFWMASQVRPGFMIPAEAISGTLLVSDEGLSSLSLNGAFTKEGDILAMFDFDELPEDAFIAGVLRSDARKVLLTGLRRGNRKFIAGGITHEEYTATHCLVGEIDECSGFKDLHFSCVSMGLESYEDWLGYKLIDTREVGNSLLVKVDLPDAISFRVNDDIEIVFNGKYLGSWGPAEQGRNLSLSAGIDWELHFNKPVLMKDAEHYFRVVSEFLMLLSGSGCNPDWPVLSNVRDERVSRVKLYFLREKQEVKRAKFHDGFVYFKDIKAIIGQLFERWMILREAMGPGAYLFFLALTPGRLYIEHLYASMVWGMERYHRKLYGNSIARNSEQIERQLQAIDTLSMLKSRQRKALKEFVSRDVEPSLKDRLICLIKDLPVYFEQRSLDEFCDACARRRNDISHFGGYREQATEEAMSDFYRELQDKIFVLTHLYASVLLKAIGVPDIMINNYFYNWRKSGWLKRHFESAGLKYQVNGFVG